MKLTSSSPRRSLASTAAFTALALGATSAHALFIALAGTGSAVLLTDVVGDLLDPMSPLGGTLGLGVSLGNLEAPIRSVDSNESGGGRFNRRVDFTEFDAPPEGVPEPQTAALVLAGMLSCVAVRQRAARALRKRHAEDRADMHPFDQPAGKHAARKLRC